MELAVNYKMLYVLFTGMSSTLMIRQPFSYESEAIHVKNKYIRQICYSRMDYDLGRNGVAYYDKRQHS